MESEKKRAAKWSIELPSYLSWLKPLIMSLLEPLLEKYLTKLQDKSTAWVRKSQGDVLADTWKSAFWSIIDEVDDEFGIELDDLTPEK